MKMKKTLTCEITLGADQTLEVSITRVRSVYKWEWIVEGGDPPSNREGSLEECLLSFCTIIHNLPDIRKAEINLWEKKNRKLLVEEVIDFQEDPDVSLLHLALHLSSRLIPL